MAPLTDLGHRRRERAVCRLVRDVVADLRAVDVAHLLGDLPAKDTPREPCVPCVAHPFTALPRRLVHRQRYRANRVPDRPAHARARTTTGSALGAACRAALTGEHADRSPCRA